MLVLQIVASGLSITTSLLILADIVGRKLHQGGKHRR